MTTFTLDLRPEPVSAPQARAAIREFLLAAWLDADIAHLSARIEDALLVTTELVSNAIRHGSGHVHLHAAADIVDGEPTVCLECSDDGEWNVLDTNSPQLLEDTFDTIGDGGRGLMIVQALCSEVVISHQHPGSLVRACLP